MVRQVLSGHVGLHGGNNSASIDEQYPRRKLQERTRSDRRRPVARDTSAGSALYRANSVEELDEKDRAALKGWAEAELNTIGRRRKSARLAMLQEVLNVLDASAPEGDE